MSRALCFSWNSPSAVKHWRRSSRAGSSPSDCFFSSSGAFRILFSHEMSSMRASIYVTRGSIGIEGDIGIATGIGDETFIFFFFIGAMFDLDSVFFGGAIFDLEAIFGGGGPENPLGGGGILTLPGGGGILRFPGGGPPGGNGIFLIASPLESIPPGGGGGPRESIPLCGLIFADYPVAAVLILVLGAIPIPPIGTDFV